jgi:magnesium chelatase subunit D
VRVVELPLGATEDRVARTGSGRRCRTRAASRLGRYARSRMDSRAHDLALDATLRAAAVQQVRRGHAGPGIQVERDDFRRKVRERRVGTCIVLAVDASGSMGVRERMVAAKGAVLSLLMDAYQKRDKVALVAFRGETAEVLLPPTSSVELAYKVLEDLPTGGRTPLSHGLEAAYGVLAAQLRRDPGAIPVLVLISDCRANVARHGGKPLHEARELAEGIREDGRIRTLVIDTEPTGVTAFGLARELAGHMGAGYHRMEDLRARDIVTALRQELSP